MLKKSITFKDFNGSEITEDFYFHLNTAEIMKWLTTSGNYTLDKLLERLIEERNGKKIMNIFEDLISMSYGKPSLDGRKFVKNDELREDFLQTEAYSQLFMELVTDAKKAADFINAIIPKDLSDEVSKIMEENPEGIPDELRDYASNSQGSTTPLA